MKIAIHLGYQVASLQLPEQREYFSASLRIMQPSSTDEHVYSPAESVEISTIHSLRLLKEFLNQHIPD